MITVTILINGNTLTARSAKDTGERTPDGSKIYLCDTGEKIVHHRDAGAVELAIKMLRTIREESDTPKMRQLSPEQIIKGRAAAKRISDRYKRTIREGKPRDTKELKWYPYKCDSCGGIACYVSSKMTGNITTAVCTRCFLGHQEPRTIREGE
jgi:hypothetical protein